jgi:hypothetical protein
VKWNVAASISIDGLYVSVARIHCAAHQCADRPPPCHRRLKFCPGQAAAAPKTFQAYKVLRRCSAAHHRWVAATAAARPFPRGTHDDHGAMWLGIGLLEQAFFGTLPRQWIA